jgi:hypothetical protein
MAVCFHLWHAENVRDRLAVNDALLGDALENPGHVCANGIEKLNPFDVSQPEDD